MQVLRVWAFPWAWNLGPLSPDHYYDVVPLGSRFKGIGGVRGFYQALAAAVPDLHIGVSTEYDVPGCSIREVVITGTHKGEFAGVKPLGNPIRLEMAASYSFDAGSGTLISERCRFFHIPFPRGFWHT